MDRLILGMVGIWVYGLREDETTEANAHPNEGEAGAPLDRTPPLA